jgi:hypothetical protein
LRLDRYFDALLGFWEDGARRKLQRLLLAADQRIPRRTRRPLAFEQLENRWMPRAIVLAWLPTRSRESKFPSAPASASTACPSSVSGSFLTSTPLQLKVIPGGSSNFPTTGSPDGMAMALTYASSTVDVDPIVATPFTPGAVPVSCKPT